MTILITIEGEGLSLKKETTLQKAGQIITFLGSGEENSPIILTKETDLLAPNFNQGRTPGELIIESNAKTNAEKILVLGNYITSRDQTESFSTKEILIELKKIGGEPHNFSRDLKTSLSLNYIYPIDAKEGRYGISQIGKQAIEAKFSSKVRNKTHKKVNGAKKVATPPRQEILNMPKVTTLEDFPDFHSLPAKSDSILWSLAYAYSQNVESLTPREIEILTDKLLNKIAQKDFSAHNKRNMKAGYVSSNGGQYKLQQKGIDYLKTLIKNEKEIDK